jgi:hypothetical protein
LKNRKDTVVLPKSVPDPIEPLVQPRASKVHEKKSVVAKCIIELAIGRRKQVYSLAIQGGEGLAKK